MNDWIIHWTQNWISERIFVWLNKTIKNGWIKDDKWMNRWIHQRKNELINQLNNKYFRK